MAVLSVMPTKQYSGRSARLIVAHRGHLNLEIQTAFWERNDILWNQIAKLQSQRRSESETVNFQKRTLLYNQNSQFGDENDIFENKTAFEN